MAIHTIGALVVSLFFLPSTALAQCPAREPRLHAGSQEISYEQRTYSISVPEPCLRARCGLIVDLHGTSMTPEMQDAVTHLRMLGSDATRFGAATPYVVLQPQAPGHPARWSEEDPERVFQAVRCITAQLPLDPARWHLDGYSLGAYLAASIACAHPGTFASYGLIAGGADKLASCMRSAGPALYIHGVEDDIIPFVTAQRLATAARNAVSPDGRVESINATRTRYVADGLWIETLFHHGRSAILGAHCAPGGSGPIGCAADFDTGTELLKFYIDHARR